MSTDHPTRTYSCTGCGKRKPASGFHASKRDGRVSRCKVCIREYQLRWRQANREAINARSRARYDYDTALAAKRRYLSVPENLVKERARTQLNTAIGAGVISRPAECQECGSGRHVEAHHDDYSKPLDVRWLCGICHGRQHWKEDDAA